MNRRAHAQHGFTPRHAGAYAQAKGEPLAWDVRAMRRLSLLLLWLVLAMALLVMGNWVLNRPLFSIAQIVVRGDVNHNNDVTLRANVVHQLSGNFFSLNLRQAKAAFESVPWVRHAQVRRSFPNQLIVNLEEQKPFAFWGEDGASTLVNPYGEVFEANVGEIDQDDLPRLNGPVELAPQVLNLYQRLGPVFAPLGFEVDALALDRHGDWHATLSTGAEVVLGSGSVDEVLARTQAFCATLTEISARYNRHATALAAADLRHNQGYALQLKGVSTLTSDAAPAPLIQHDSHSHR
jgi:cell division protein FtsQ